MKLIKQGDESLFGNKRCLFVHFEYTSVCNRRCSYCLEGNGNPEKIKEEFSDEKKILSAIDKIFGVSKDDEVVFFIIAGGEPTLQPSFKSVLNKIYSRQKTGAIITTNLSQPVELYKSFNTPLVASLHLEDTNINEFLSKVEQLKDLMAHVRLMAHPSMHEEVKKTYEKLLKLNEKHNIDFAVEKLFPVAGWAIDYNPQDLEEINNMGHHLGKYPESLSEKMGLARNLFYRSLYHYKDKNKIITKQHGRNKFKRMFCERNLLVVNSDGKIQLAWCEQPDINIFEAEALPRDIFSTVVCKHKHCPMGFASNLAKYKSAKYSPSHVKKSELTKLKLFSLFKK